jgi:glycosyltransferase involved in cell wall biosynthesis
MNLPLVTIVTPSFNQGNYVEATIKSVLNQTYPLIEYIFVDGGSTDQTMNIVEKYKYRIDVIIHEKDQGQADAINKGFKLAKGELVGWLNSDDIIYPQCIERIVDKYKYNPKGAVFYIPNLDWINETGKIIAQREVIIKDRNFLLNTNYLLIQPGSFYSKKLVEKVNYLDINNHYCMDLALWLDLLKFGPIFHIDSNEPMAAFRMYAGTKTDTGRIKFLMNIKKVLLQKGAKWYSRNIIVGIYYYSIKFKIKNVLWTK